MHQSVTVSMMPHVLRFGVKTGVEPCLTVSQTVVRAGTLSPQLNVLPSREAHTVCTLVIHLIVERLVRF